MNELSDNPLVVVGMACRFPGGADGVDAYWSLLESGMDVTSEIPAERWDVDELYSTGTYAGRTEIRRGGFLHDLRGFDAAFFGISEAEARSTDPQHRLLLETSWTALEDAGIPPLSLRGSRTGVFVGPAQNGFLTTNSKDLGFGGANGLYSVAAGRIAHFYDLAGPTLSLDTACSTSLVALHLARQSLAAGECDMAIVAASNAIVTPLQTLLLGDINVLSPEGRCKTFSDNADGFARAEGSGALVVMPLRSAREQRLTIKAVIHSTAINHDGHTPALIAPSASAQYRVLESALRRGGVQPRDVTFVETHGTGTAVGDPKEVEGIMRALGGDRSDRVTLGAVKTNLGHLEQGAGMAALMKTILGLQRKEIAPNVLHGQLNPALDLATSPGRIPTQRVPWRASGGGRRLAGVSGFGFSGTNAHVVLEEADEYQHLDATEPRDQQVLCLSAKTESALATLAGNLDEFLRASPSVDIRDVAYTLGVGRSHFQHRVAFVCSSTQTAREALRAVVEGEDHPALVRGRTTEPARVAFLYSGQGSQTPGMSKDLFDTEPVFRAALSQCEELLGGELDQPLLDVMFAGTDAIHDTRYAQLCLFASQYALAELLASWGIRPDALIGHSIGEFAAAVAAGVMSLQDALWLVNQRSIHMAQAQRGGAMVAFSAGVDDLADLLMLASDQVSIAAVNGPKATVLSGDGPELEQLMETASQLGIRGTRLTVSHAFHSPHMDSILDGFEAKAAQLDFSAPQIPLMSNVTGRPADAATFDARYFRDHIRQAVQFGPGVAALVEDGCQVFLEIGPHPVLSPMAAQTAPGARTIGMQVRGQDGAAAALRAVAALYTQGVEVDWSAFYAGREGQRISLPTMPFEHKQYWPRDSGPMWSEVARQEILRPLAQRRSAAAPDPDQFASDIDFESHPYFTDHRVAGIAIFPGAGFIEMMLEALECEWPHQEFDVQGIVFERVAILPADGSRQFTTRFESNDDGSYRVEVYGRPAGAGSGTATAQPGEWERHASATAVLAAADDPVDDPARLVEQWFTEFSIAVDVGEHYAQLAAGDLDYGPLFRGVQRLWRSDEHTTEAVAEVRLPLEVDASSYRVHPVLLDSCFHAIGVAQRGLETAAGTFLPAGVDKIVLGRTESVGQSAAVSQVLCHVRVSATSSPDILTVDVDITSAGQWVMRLLGLRLQRTEGASLRRLVHRPVSDTFVVPQWEKLGPVAAVDTTALSGQAWLILGDGMSLTRGVVTALQAAGATPFLLTTGATATVDCDSETVDARSAASIAAAMRNVFARAGQIDRVLCLWPSGLGHPPFGTDTTAAQMDWQSGTSVAADSDAALKALELGCGGALYAAQALLSLKPSSHPAFVLVSKGAHRVVEGEYGVPLQAAVWGLGRVMSVEHPELRCTLVDLDPAGDSDLYPGQVLSLGQLPDSEWQTAVRDGARYVFRLAPLINSRTRLEVPAAESFALVSRKPGALDELALEPSPAPVPAADEIQIAVEAASINFRDVMNALGVYPGDPEPLGKECAGTVTAVGSEVTEFRVGDRVFAMAREAFRSVAVATASRAVVWPPELSAAHAAGIPLAYPTVHHALCTLAQLRRGETVLIHSAAGGVGQAAVQYAQVIGANVIATAGNPRKRELLRQLGVRHVFDSRSLAFEHEVQALTDGQGVDVVLNSLAGEFVPATLRTVKSGGRFVEIGKVTVLRPEEVPDGISYFHFDLATLPPDQLRGMFQEVAARMQRSELRPVPTTIFDVTDSIQAFRHMAAGRHVGKLALRFGHESQQLDLSGTPGTYLITGGLGGVGLVMAKALLTAGASRIVLVSRRSVTEDVIATVRDLDPTGKRVVVETCDVAEASSVAAVMATIKANHPPLRGIIHAAGVTDDMLLAQQTWDSMQRVMAVKVLGAYHLHTASFECPLDFFVLFSSMTSLLGTAGQANYAAGNAFLDGLANYRQSLGLPGVSINWGAFSEVGMAVRDGGKLLANMTTSGMETISPEEGVEAFQALVASHESQVAVIPTNWAKYVQHVPGSLRVTLGKFDTASKQSGGAKAGIDLSTATVETVAELIGGEIRKLLYLPADAVLDDQVPLDRLGLDSLMAVELRNILGRRLGLTLSATLLFDYPALAPLAEHLAYDQLGLEKVPAASSETPTGGAAESGSAAGGSPEPRGAGLRHVVAQPDAERRDLEKMLED